MPKTRSAKETHALARTFVLGLKPRQSARVIGLIGELGAGKTTFVQGAARALGVMDAVTSPTFVIEKRYILKNHKSLANQSFETLVHIDAYRLESAGDLEPLRFNETLTNPKNLVFVEWPERVEEILPDDTVLIRFEGVNENTRRVTFPENF